MTITQRKDLAALLSERVRDKADLNDVVGMFSTARMLDQVNGELRDLGELPPEEAKVDPAAIAPGRRVFVHG